MNFIRETASQNNFRVIFEDIASKLEKNWRNFFKFQSISVIVIRNNRPADDRGIISFSAAR